MKKRVSILLALTMLATMFVGCADKKSEESTGGSSGGTSSTSSSNDDGGSKTIALCTEDLETEFWVAAHEAIVDTLEEQGIKVVPEKYSVLCDFSLL
ncbi:hypothetical protein [Muricomes intestini]|jgi:inositol transport system substrate-binding protein|uniref:hypothetical protein n=1 Tax=Muricomes intestini TaxID=1796634 RepID=UPI002FDA00C4